MKDSISEKTLISFQKLLHELIDQRVGEFLIIKDFEPPSLELIKSSFGSDVWFPIDGMYGGFNFSVIFNEDESQYQLISESWSRVVGGSGQRHLITEDSCELVEDGFA